MCEVSIRTSCLTSRMSCLTSSMFFVMPACASRFSERTSSMRRCVPFTSALHHAGDESVSGARLDGQPVDEIYTDLTARRDGTGVDLTGVRHLPENAGVAFMGDTKGGPFDVAGDQAHEWLRLPARALAAGAAPELAPPRGEVVLVALLSTCGTNSPMRSAGRNQTPSAS